MVKVKDNLVGKVFGRLTVLEQADDYITPNGIHVARWLCECSCLEHNKIKVVGNKLKNYHTQSCGCLQKDRASQIHKKYNSYSEKLVDEHGEYYIGWTFNTNNEFYFDADDFDLIKNFCWYEHINSKTGYHSLETTEHKTQKHFRMHQLIGAKYRDHADRNPLNNRKFNLREAEHKQNMQNRSVPKNNTSGVIGVSWDKQREKWCARIRINGTQRTLGRFDNKEDAIIARLKAEQQYFGEFAPQQHLFNEHVV